MKTGSKILIWFTCVLLSCCVTVSLYGTGAGVTAIPHANVQLLVPSGKTTDQLAEQAEIVIKSLGYIKQPSDGLSEWTYKKGDFTILYDLEDDKEYGKTVVWLHFYDWCSDYFDESGMAEYLSFIDALKRIGLEPTWTNDPRYPGRTVFTPEMFNAEYAPNPTLNRVQSAMFGFALLLLYGVVILWPIFWIEIKLINRLSMPVGLKRVLFVVFNSLLLAPSPIPLPLLGPLPLIPALFMLPLIFASPEFLKLIAISIAGTGVVTLVISLFIRNSPSTNTNSTST